MKPGRARIAAVAAVVVVAADTAAVAVAVAVAAVVADTAAAVAIAAVAAAAVIAVAAVMAAAVAATGSRAGKRRSTEDHRRLFNSKAPPTVDKNPERGRLTFRPNRHALSICTLARRSKWTLTFSRRLHTALEQ
jgi:hypothetical protein